MSFGEEKEEDAEENYFDEVEKKNELSLGDILHREKSNNKYRSSHNCSVTGENPHS